LITIDIPEIFKASFNKESRLNDIIQKSLLKDSYNLMMWLHQPFFFFFSKQGDFPWGNSVPLSFFNFSLHVLKLKQNTKRIMNFVRGDTNYCFKKAGNAFI